METVMQSGKHIRVIDAAEILGFSKEWVYRLIEAGELPAEDHYVAGMGTRKLALLATDDYLRLAEPALKKKYADEPLKLHNAMQRLQAETRKRANKLKVLDEDEHLAGTEVVAARYDRGESIYTIAKDLHKSPRTIKVMLAERGAQPRPGGRVGTPGTPIITADLEKIMEQMHREGASPRTIARRLGWDDTRCDRVRRHLRRLGVHTRTRSEASQIRWHGIAAASDGEESS